MAVASTVYSESTQVLADFRKKLRDETAIKYLVPCGATAATIWLATKVLWPRKRAPTWEWDLSEGLQAKKWSIYGGNVLDSQRAILGVVGVWRSGKTTVQRIFGAKALPEKNRGIYAARIPNAVVVECLGADSPMLGKNLCLDEQELTARFARDIVTEIAHGILLVIGDRMGLDDLRLLEEMTRKCRQRNIPLFVWHNIRRTNTIPVFRERMHSLYAADVDYSGNFDAPDQTCHLTGGIRAKLQIERVMHGLRATVGGIPSVGTLSDKIETAGSQILSRFFGGINSPDAETSGFDDGSSDVSETPLKLHLVFKREEASERRQKRWWSRRVAPAGHFEVQAAEYSEPLELRCLHSATGLSAGWIPACCVYETTEPNGRIVKNIELETPGVSFEDVEIQATKSGVKVSVRKRVPYHDTLQTKVDEDSRCYGLFVRNFCFHDTDAIYQPIPPPEGLGMRDGVLLVRLWKVEMNQTVKRRMAGSAAGDTLSSLTMFQDSMTPLEMQSRATAV